MQPLGRGQLPTSLAPHGLGVPHDVSQSYSIVFSLGRLVSSLHHRQILTLSAPQSCPIWQASYLNLQTLALF